MRTLDILRLYREFEYYDRHTKDYATKTPKLERFNDYLTKLKNVCSVMQILLETSDIEIIDADSISLNEYEVDSIDKAVKYFIRVEKKRIAALACP